MSFKIEDKEISSERSAWIAYWILTENRCKSEIPLSVMKNITSKMWATFSSTTEENAFKIKRYAISYKDKTSDIVKSAWTVYHIFMKVIQDAELNNKNCVHWECNEQFKPNRFQGEWSYDRNDRRF